MTPLLPSGAAGSPPPFFVDAFTPSAAAAVCVYLCSIVHVASFVPSCLPSCSDGVYEFLSSLEEQQKHSRGFCGTVEVGYQGGPGYAFWNETLSLTATLASYFNSRLPLCFTYNLV